MAVERIQLVPDEVLKKETIKEKVLKGEITKENFDDLSEDEQEKVKDILFDMASEEINLFHGVSSLEFILMGTLRVINKQMNNIALTETDEYIKDTLSRITEKHELSNTNFAKEDWLMDYMAYAEGNATKILENRMNYLSQKRSIID